MIRVVQCAVVMQVGSAHPDVCLGVECGWVGTRVSVIENAWWIRVDHYVSAAKPNTTKTRSLSLCL